MIRLFHSIIPITSRDARKVIILSWDRVYVNVPSAINNIIMITFMAYMIKNRFCYRSKTLLA